MLGPPSNHVTRHGWCVLEGVNINTLRRSIRLGSLGVQLGLNILTKHAIFFQPSQTMYIIMTVWHLDQSYPLLKTHYYALWTWVTWCHSQQAIGWWGGRAWAQWVYRGVKIFDICSYLFSTSLDGDGLSVYRWALGSDSILKEQKISPCSAHCPQPRVADDGDEPVSLCQHMGKAAQGMYSELKSMKHCAGGLSLWIKLC